MLPFRSDKLFFPTGEMIGTYWYEEIKTAVTCGACNILEHYSSLIYEKEEHVFDGFVEDFNKIKNSGKLFKHFAKNMINGLYGSFALNDETEITILCFNEVDFNSFLTSTDVIKWIKRGDFYILTIEKNFKSKNFFDKKNRWSFDFKKRNLAYATIISSKARIKLFKALRDVINSGGELYYTDTDSIFAGYDKNNLNKSVGEIKWQKIYEDAVFISNKFYFLKNEKIKLKGINSKEDYTFEEIKHKFFNNEELLIYENQLVFLKKNYQLHQNYAKKIIKLNNYNKRIFSHDKFKTTPLNVNTWKIPD
jgi:hypothetical protein